MFTKKLIRVPKNEAYYFCKRIFFHIYGDVGCCFADTLENIGWVGYPSYTSENNEPNILLFSDEQHLSQAIEVLNNSDKRSTLYCKYNIGIIITDAEAMDIEQLEFFDKIVDLTSLKDYYQTELSLDIFIRHTLKMDNIQNSTTSQKD